MIKILLLLKQLSIDPHFTENDKNLVLEIVLKYIDEYIDDYILSFMEENFQSTLECSTRIFRTIV